MVFTLLNDLRRSRHCVRPASLRHPDDTPYFQYSRVRSSTADNADLSTLKICAADATCQSRCRQPTSMYKAYILASLLGYTQMEILFSWNMSVALLNLRFAAVPKKSRRRGRWKVSWLKNKTRSVARRGAVMQGRSASK